MKSFADIKRRINSVSDTRKITGALETISTVKMRRAMGKYESNKAYFFEMRRMITEISSVTPLSSHKVFSSSPCSSAAVVAIASDKGFVGNFNHAVLECAREQIEKCGAKLIYGVGLVALEYFSAAGIKVNEEFAASAFDPTIEDAARIGEVLYEKFISGEIDSAYVVYTAIGEYGKGTPEVIRLLPFERANGTVCGVTYEPSAEKVLGQLVPQYLSAILYGALIQSAACEHSVRRASMNSAQTNATDILEELKVEYNRARQEAITNELSDIITASNGVKYEG